MANRRMQNFLRTLGTGLLWWLGAGAAWASEDPRLPTPTELNAFCDTNRVQGFEFGRKNVHGARDFDKVIGRFPELEHGLGPFDRFSLQQNAWTRELHSGSGTYIGPRPSQEWFAAMDRLIRSQGWQSPPDLMGRPGLFGVEDYLWVKPMGDPEKEIATMLAIYEGDFSDDPDETTLLLICGRNDLVYAHSATFSPFLMKDTPRPVPPRLHAVLTGEPPVCDAQAHRPIVRNLLMTVTPETLVTDLLDYAEFRAKLVTWKGWQLQIAGLDLDRWLYTIDSAPEFDPDISKAVGRVIDAREAMEQMVDQAGNGDLAAACDSLSGVRKAVAAVKSDVDAFYGPVDSLYSRKAEKMGLFVD